MPGKRKTLKGNATMSLQTSASGIVYRRLNYKDALDKWLEGKDKWNKWAEDIKSRENLDHTEIFFENDPSSNDSQSSGKIDYSSAIKKWRGIKSEWPFEDYIFPKAILVFNGCTFTAEINSFKNVQFNGGEILFKNCEFRGNTSFENTQLNAAKIEFIECKFYGHTSLANLVNTDGLEQFNFRLCQFHGTFEISSARMLRCVPDFTESKFYLLGNRNLEATHHEKRKNMLLQGLICKPRSSWIISNSFPFFTRKYDSKDLNRLDILRDLSNENNDHNTALQFQGQKMRLMRWDQRHSGFIDSFFDAIYSALSSYGRSSGRPALYLFLLFIISALGSASFGNISYFSVEPYKLSLLNSFPLIPGTGDLREELIKDCFLGVKQNWAYIFSTLQSVLSLILIFLIGLGFRNRYKIKF